MKNKALIILLSVSCVLASCLPNLLINPTKETVIIENVSLEESADNATWGEIYKDADAYQKAYEESVKAYNEQMQALTDQVNALQNDPQMANLTELYKQMEKAEKENVVKSIKYDSYGKIKVGYANGKSDVIDVLKGAPTTTVSNQANETVTHDYEKVGYVLKSAIDFPYIKYQDTAENLSASITDFHFNDSLKITINSIKCELIEIDNNNPSKKYKYKTTCDYSFECTQDFPLSYVTPSVNYPSIDYGLFSWYCHLDNTDKSIGAGEIHIDSLNFQHKLTETYFTSSIPYVEYNFSNAWFEFDNCY